MPKKHVLTLEQLESLTSPIRLAIIQRLEMDKQATARELAHRMGRPATALYHHLKQMENLGLIRVAAEQKGTRRPEAVYAMVANQFSSSEAVKTPEGRETYGRAGTRVADAGARAFSSAVSSGEARFTGAERNAMVRFFVLRADKKKLRRLNALLQELEEEATQSCEEGEEIQLTVLLSAIGK
ncbi:helix-turn-helix domain-containing protein [Terriglobus sp. RCC_193]|uniref:helix-turn-helix domain-containing protein n=1 Tax=Terriglobus sp. RCC_193 TaxID=3239218 RepID=UPI003525033E